ncbi:HalOD1 output domain-containing protein [Natrinema sp. 1APR25-10V2]|uniref:HalOD1 output domain-containing protein n=1 Tax=Natrinema sp. 1APR25-10V2 TaxID=2951081 RepID=UPI0028743D32|nr:HalOD1 output domain-containing protein [Natrinema sp. 1APR25-10V2]MDS0474678.1 hypothetical protein [Natrinema sp. 1APR25-10V2]
MDSGEQPIMRKADSEALPVAVVNAIAEAKQVDPDELSPKLADVIDPDALADLFRGSDAQRGEGELVFAFGEHDVRVHASGVVEVTSEETYLVREADD